MIYFDTHVAAAVESGEIKFLSRQAVAAIDRDADRRISPMAVLELELLREIGRLKVPVAKILQNLSNDIGLRVCDASFPDVISQASTESWTRDPFDRIIVAQARLAKAVLVTRDGIIQKHYNRALA